MAVRWPWAISISLCVLEGGLARYGRGPWAVSIFPFFSRHFNFCLKENCIILNSAFIFVFEFRKSLMHLVQYAAYGPSRAVCEIIRKG